MKMAAAEALYDTSRPGLVLAVHHRHAWTAPRRSGASGCRGCCRSWPPVDSTARSRASTTCRPPPRRSYGPGDYTPEHPGHLLDVPDHDRVRRCWPCCCRSSACGCTRAGPRAEVRAGSYAALAGIGCSCRSRPTASAGSSPRWAASPGRWSACCAPPTGSPPASAPASVLTSLIVFTLLYGVLAVIEVSLMVRYARKGPDPPPPPDATAPSADDPRPPPPPTAVGLLRSRTSRSARPEQLLVPAHRRAVDRLLRPGGLRLRRRRAAAASSAGTRRAAGS